MISVYDMVYDTLKICPDKSSGIARDLSRIALKNKDIAKLATDEIAAELNDFVLEANRKYATNFVVDSAVVDSAALDYSSKTDALTLHAVVHVSIRDVLLNPATETVSTTNALPNELPKPNAFSFVRLFTFKVIMDREHGCTCGIFVVD